MRFAWILLVVPLLILGACSTATTEKYEAVLASWVGHHVDALVLEWGPPDKDFTLTDGSRVVEYQTSGSYRVPGVTTYVPRYTATDSGYVTTYDSYSTSGFNVNLQCDTRFRLSADGYVRDWSWHGNACVSE